MSKEQWPFKVQLGSLPIPIGFPAAVDADAAVKRDKERSCLEHEMLERANTFCDLVEEVHLGTLVSKHVETKTDKAAEALADLLEIRARLEKLS